MKQTLCIVLTSLFFACNQQNLKSSVSQRRIDSLEQKLAHTFKPGFGEFMSGIQAHHTKLWFAGQNENWKLAEFEVHEIMESIEDIQEYQSERKESTLIAMIKPALERVNNAIEKQSLEQFKNAYALLTNTCNNCHQNTNFEFIKIKIPETQPFPNQDFKIN